MWHSVVTAKGIVFWGKVAVVQLMVDCFQNKMHALTDGKSHESAHSSWQRWALWKQTKKSQVLTGQAREMLDHITSIEIFLLFLSISFSMSQTRNSKRLNPQKNICHLFKHIFYISFKQNFNWSHLFIAFWPNFFLPINFFQSIVCDKTMHSTLYLNHHNSGFAQIIFFSSWTEI